MKMTLEISDHFHRTVKSMASAQGESMKDFIVNAVTKEIKNLKPNTKTPVKKTQKKNSKYITEKEADRLLKPYILKAVKSIQDGTAKVYSKEEFFRKLKED
jgi:hypothetical protein